MDQSAQVNTIINSFGDEFFDKLAEDCKIKVPDILRNILLFNDIDCAQVLSRFDDENIQSLELFMRNEFSMSMVTGDNPQIRDYYGRYEFSPQKFCFSMGHKIILKVLVVHCAQKLNISSSFEKRPPSSIERTEENESAEEQEAKKKKLICLLFQSLFDWMKNKAVFAEVFLVAVKAITRNVRNTKINF